MSSMKVRFAPSPTGPFHIGGARSALFNWLLARKEKGTFVLRIEDTDLARSTRESEENIKASLQWLGMNWDEGIDVGGNNGPYRQTERLDLYKEVTQRLLDEGKAYECYCTPEELDAVRQDQMDRGETPKYNGHCEHLDEETKAKYIAEGRKPTIRLRVPLNKTYAFDDMVRGHVSFESNGVGDFVIVKSDGIPVYNFAVVMDDHMMGITHVIRAEEHLSNTPRQMAIYEALGWEVPKFDLCLPHLKEVGLAPDSLNQADIDWLTLLCSTFRDHISYGAQIKDHVGLFMGETVFLEEGHEEELRAVLNEETAPTVLGAFRNALAELDEITPEVVKATIKAVMKETSLKGKFVFMPIRVALTGQMHGPDLNNIVTLLGKEKCLHRLDNVGALTK